MDVVEQLFVWWWFTRDIQLRFAWFDHVSRRSFFGHLSQHTRKSWFEKEPPGCMDRFVPARLFGRLEEELWTLTSFSILFTPRISLACKRVLVSFFAQNVICICRSTRRFRAGKACFSCDWIIGVCSVGSFSPRIQGQVNVRIQLCLVFGRLSAAKQRKEAAHCETHREICYRELWSCGVALWRGGDGHGEPGWCRGSRPPGQPVSQPVSQPASQGSLGLFRVRYYTEKKKCRRKGRCSEGMAWVRRSECWGDWEPSVLQRFPRPRSLAWREGNEPQGQRVPS